MACRLTLLGPPQLLDERGRVLPIPAKAFALAAFILLSGGAPVSRSSLREFLWETPDSKIAATNLRKFLLRIRQRQQRFGFEFIVEDRDHIRLAEDVEVDLARLLSITEDHGSGLAEFCDLYRGELLEGLDWDDEESREWLAVQRTNLREAFVAAITARLEPGTSEDRVTTRAAARRLIEVDPYNETGHRVLMRLFAEEGEPTRVREVYRGLEQRLRDELGAEPDPATTELLGSLLNARTLQARPPVDLSAEPRALALPIDVQSDPDNREIPAFNAEARRSGIPRVTILPPVAIGGQDYAHQLAASLIEDVTIGLCRFKSLSVVAPHTASELSQSEKKTLLRSFNIDYAVETKLQNRDSELALAVKLVNAVTRDILWVDQYAFNRESMAKQYRDLSVRIVSLLVDTIERVELGKYVARYDVEQDPTAYHLFLTGQRLLRSLDLPSVRKARRAFRASIGSFSDFVPAISGLAHTFHLEWLLMARGDNDLLADAERLAHRSLEIDPDDARGYRDLGLCSIYAGRFDESLEAFGHAERRNPQYADLLVDYADALQHSCDAAAALQKIEQAIELNPLGPDRYWWVAADVNFHLERYTDAINCMSRMRDQSPAFRLIAASWAMLGEKERAKEYVRRAKDIHPDFSVDAWLSILPIRTPEFASRYKHGLREAGFD